MLRELSSVFKASLFSKMMHFGVRGLSMPHININVLLQTVLATNKF